VTEYKGSLQVRQETKVGPLKQQNKGHSQQNICKCFKHYKTLIFCMIAKMNSNLSSLFFLFNENLNIWHCLYVWTNLVTLCIEDSMLLFLFVCFCFVNLHYYSTWRGVNQKDHGAHGKRSRIQTPFITWTHKFFQPRNVKIYLVVNTTFFVHIHSPQLSPWMVN